MKCRDCKWGKEDKYTANYRCCQRIYEAKAKFGIAGYDHDGLWVDDDFGCVQWEREDKQTRMVVELHAGGEACRFKAKKEYVKIPAKGDNPPGAGPSL